MPKDISSNFPAVIVETDKLSLDVSPLPLTSGKKGSFGKLKRGGMKLFKGLKRHSSTGSSATCDTSVCSDVSSICPTESFTPSNKSYSRCKHVQFSDDMSSNDVQVVEPLLPYASDLWWTKDEIKDCRLDQSDFVHAPDEEKKAAQAYMQAYTIAREMIFAEEDDQKPSLPIKLYEELVAGHAKGYTALEIYSKTANSKRKEDAKAIVSASTAAYYDFMILKKHPQPSKVLRSYVRSLTAKDRYWAAIMGQVESDATTV